MSVVSEQEYLSQLHAIQSNNPPSQVLFPELNTIYDIDLYSRTVEAPKVLSISKDHEAETIYFRVDRYHDFMDLSLVAGIVQFVTPDKQTHWYPIPFYDITTEKDNDKMLIPWCVNGDVTKYSGKVTFSFKFFLVEREIVNQSDEIDDESLTGAVPPEVRYKLIYNLTTLSATSEILDGMEVESMKSDFYLPANDVAALWAAINGLQKYQGVSWILADPK